MPAGKRIIPKNVDEYIRSFPDDAGEKLEKLRMVIRQTAPGAEEVISYGMPAYRYSGMLVYFAAFKNHYSLFPASSETFRHFRKELSQFELSKGTIRFPIDKTVPVSLIKKIIKFRLKENIEKALLKPKKITRKK